MSNRSPPHEVMRYTLDEFNLSNRSIAALFDVNEATVSRWINGHQPIPRAVFVSMILLSSYSNGSEDRVKKMISFLVAQHKGTEQ